MLYELILINEIEQRAKIIFLSEGTQGEDGILNSGCGWLEVLCVCGGENWLLIVLGLSVKKAPKSSALIAVVGGGEYIQLNTCCFCCV